MRADSDFDFDGDRRGGRWGSVLRVLTVIGEAAAVLGAVAILYLAFRGPSGHPSASPAPTTASRDTPYATGAPRDQGAAVRPAPVPSATPSVTASPSASAEPSASQAAGPLARAQSYLAGRRGRTEVAVYDLSGGRQWTLGSQAPQAEGSTVNLEILAAVLHQRRVQRTVLSLPEQELTPPMIEQNDAGAASTMWKDVGGAKGMRAFDHAARLTHTSPATGSSQGLTTTTPQDQVTLLRQLAKPSGVLDPHDQKYALRLLENVTPEQRWGVSGGVPADATVALKNGLVPLDGGKDGWQVNSVGWVSGGGRNYLMAVLSTGDPGERYGIGTLNHLGAMAWSALAPRRG